MIVIIFEGSFKSLIADCAEAILWVILETFDCSSRIFFVIAANTFDTAFSKYESVWTALRMQKGSNHHLLIQDFSLVFYSIYNVYAR